MMRGISALALWTAGCLVLVSAVKQMDGKFSPERGAGTPRWPQGTLPTASERAPPCPRPRGTWRPSLGGSPASAPLDRPRPAGTLTAPPRRTV